jgi:ribosome-associated toxin RatA of RatAB toxin-antitoxin module
VADEGRGDIAIDAPAEDIWAVVCDLEAYPTWAGDIKHVAVLDVDADGRPATAEFRVGGFGVSVAYTIAYSYDPPHTVAWELVRSNELRRMDGEYRFLPADGGTTTVEYRLTVDLKIPVLGMIKRRAEKMIIHHALTGLKARVEEQDGSGRR